MQLFHFLCRNQRNIFPWYNPSISIFSAKRRSNVSGFIYDPTLFAQAGRHIALRSLKYHRDVEYILQ